jgi:ABC-type transport system substrate-binding protein
MAVPPDANSAVAALKRGEVDLIEQLPPDYITPLRADNSLKVGSGGTYQGMLVMNQLHPPFNNRRYARPCCRRSARSASPRPWVSRWTCA